MRKIKQRSQGTVEAERARQEQEKAKEESTLWRVFTSQVLIMRTIHVRFNCSRSRSFLSELHGLPACAMRTHALARREASCALVVLVKVQ